MPRPPVDKKLEPHNSKLGNVPDDDIAKSAGVSRSAVVNYRKRLGIAAYAGYKFSAAAGVPAAAGRKAKAPGKAPKKAKVAAPVAAPAPAVAVAPVKRPVGRPRKNPLPVAAPVAPSPAKAPAPKAAVAGFHGRKSKLEPFVALLGVESDAAVAAKAGVTVENVRAYRARRSIGGARGVASVAAPVAPPAPAKAAPAPAVKAAAVAGGRSAYLVTVDERGEHKNYAVLADDIAQAARAAVDGVKGRGTVRAVSKVADLL